MSTDAFNYRTILVEKDEETRITTIILNRPKKKNTITIKMLDEIIDALNKLKKNRKTRVIVFKGAQLPNPPEGKLPAFSAGADVTSGLKGYDISSPHDMASAFGEVHAKFRYIEMYPKITIAAIDGYAAGGGLEFAMCCDIRIATKRSLFALPELKLGAIPAGGGTQRLARLVGLSRAKQIIFCSQYISGGTAYNWGLVNYLTDLEEFESKIKEIALTIAKGPPIHQKLVKEVMNLGFDAPLEVGLKLERDALGIVVVTKDAQEGLMAFMQRREPNFKGK
ncbi:MAG: enoyl-CoA hydratase/isomerase family protein [Candidatus Helarchaeota archaeon]